MKNLFRTLTADEIEARVATCTEKGVSVLLYKTARTDVALLDETVGPMNWKCEYLLDNRNCRLSIWDSYKTQWITKEDTGTESNQEAEKGLASDSFKRAGFKWGIGIELYTAPFIWIPASKVKIVTGRNGRPTCNEKFVVTEISYTENRKIASLTIANRDGQTVYTYGKKPASQAPAPATAPQIAAIRDMAETSAVPIEYIVKAYGVEKLGDLTEKRAAQLITNFEKCVAAYARSLNDDKTAEKTETTVEDDDDFELPYC